ncbi:S8 family serine peptidase [Gemmatimonadota bacterium]
MRSRKVDRRPERRLVALFAVLALAPAFVGSESGRDGLSTTLPVASPDHADSLLLWLSFSPETWASPGLIPRLQAEGARIRVRSRWLQALSVEIPRHRLPSLEGIVGLRRVRPVASWSQAVESAMHRDDSFRGDGALRAGGGVADSLYGELGASLEVLDIPQAHGLGFSGSGIRVGILDGAFRADHALLTTSSLIGVRDFVDEDGSVAPDPGDPPEAATHGTALWALAAGELPQGYRGVAPGVEVLLGRIRADGPVLRVDEDRWVAGLEWLESQGARIVISGVSFRLFDDFQYPLNDLDGDTSPATRAADEAARRGVLVVAPVGNDGPGLGSLGVPADGDSVLAAGAVDSRGVVAAFSSAGPTGDGRRKPDLFAPGVGLLTASAQGYQVLERATGTEFSGALLAGAAALLVEAYPDRSPMEILGMLNRSIPPDTGAFGGVPRIASALVFPEGITAFPADEVDAEQQVTTLTPQFRWDAPLLHPLGLPVTFSLEFSEDSLFRGMYVADSVVGTFARRLQAPLPPRSRLFWRVAASSIQGIRRSSGVNGPFTVPSWVTLETLNDPSGSEIADPQPEFHWTAMGLSPPAGPFTFNLQVLSDRGEEVIRDFPGLSELRLTVPSPLPFNQPMRWRVIAEARSGTADTVTSAGPFVVTSRTRPPITILYQNFPNPFPNRETGSEETRIWFDLAESGPVELTVYDIRGRLVRHLIPSRGCPSVELEAGLYGREEGQSTDPCVSFLWDGRDDGANRVAPGVYLLRLRAGGAMEVRRVVFWP